MDRPASDRKENHLEESSILNKDINHLENGEAADNMSRHSFNQSQLLTQEGKFMSCYYNKGDTDTSDDESITILSTDNNGNNNFNFTPIQEQISQEV